MNKTNNNPPRKLLSNAEYYYLEGDRMTGPYTLNNFPISQITKNTLIWKTGLSEWQTADNFSELNLTPPPISNQKCWFCENHNAKPYTIELTKYKKRLGGRTRKYTRSVNINMCDKCAEAFDKQQEKKTWTYRIILLIEIIAVSIYIWFEPSCSAMSFLEKILGGCLFGFILGIFPAWGITALMTNNPIIGKNKLRNSIRKHPSIIAANKDGYHID